MSVSPGDPLDALLAGSRVPPLSPGFADRIVAEAVRADRVPSAAPAVRPRRSGRFGRRGVWAVVAAANLMLVSAVAAAFGTGAITGPRLIEAARHVVEQITHPAPRHAHHPPAHMHHAAVRATEPAVATPVPAPPVAEMELPPPALRDRRLLRWERRNGDPATRMMARRELRADRLARQSAHPRRAWRRFERRMRRREAMGLPPAAFDDTDAAPPFAGPLPGIDDPRPGRWRSLRPWHPRRWARRWRRLHPDAPDGAE